MEVFYKDKEGKKHQLCKIGEEDRIIDEFKPIMKERICWLANLIEIPVSRCGIYQALAEKDKVSIYYNVTAHFNPPIVLLVCCLNEETVRDFQNFEDMQGVIELSIRRILADIGLSIMAELSVLVG